MIQINIDATAAGPAPAMHESSRKLILRHFLTANLLKVTT
jgi:hypothetical protein